MPSAPTRTSEFAGTWLSNAAAVYFSGARNYFGGEQDKTGANIAQTSQKLTFNANGGSIGGSDAVIVEQGKNTNQAGASGAKATRAGYSLVGWYDKDGNLIFDARGYAASGKYWSGAYSPKVSSATWKYAGGVMAYARWVASGYSVVTFDANGGSIGDAAYACVVVQSGKNTNQAGASGTKVTRTGYTLSGWYDAPTGGNMIFNANGYAVNGTYWNGSYSPKVSSATWKYSGNVTAYARWTVKNNKNSATMARKASCARQTTAGCLPLVNSWARSRTARARSCWRWTRGWRRPTSRRGRRTAA